MIYIFLGPPGCGKGSQAQILSEKLGIRAFSAGELLRQEIAEETTIGKAIKTIYDQGHYVPDQLIWDLMRLHISPYHDQNIILDGFPRTVGQAELLVDWAKTPICAIYFDIDTAILLERILHRTMCAECGTIYNLKTKPPKQIGVCDVCGSKEFKTRADDDAEVFKQRLQQDASKSQPVVAFFETRGLLCKVDASENISTVSDQVLSIMSRESHGAY